MLALTPDEMRRATGGVRISKMSDPELTEYIIQAQDLAANYVNLDTLEYHTVQDELHSWNGSSLKFQLYEGPVRILQHYSMLLGAYGGRDISFDITETPVAITGDPAILPTNFGGIKLNRSINGGDASSFLGSVGISAPVSDFMQVQQEFTYTAGYDDGTVQGDGFTLPWPSWLKTAIRFICIDVLGDWQVGQRGLGGLQMLRVADTIFRRPTNRSKDEIVIPSKAKVILDRHFGPWVG